MGPDASITLDGGVELEYATPWPSVPSLSTPLSSRSRSPVARSQRWADLELPLLQRDNLDPHTGHEPIPTCVHYFIAWKLQLRKGRLSALIEITETNLTLAPSAYRDRSPKQTLATRVQDRLSESGHQPDETKTLHLLRRETSEISGNVSLVSTLSRGGVEHKSR